MDSQGRESWMVTDSHGQSGAIVTDSHGESWIVRGDSHGPSSASGVWRTVTYGRRQASGSAEVNPTSPLPPARPLGSFWALSLVLRFAFGPASSCLARDANVDE